MVNQPKTYEELQKELEELKVENKNLKMKYETDILPDEQSIRELCNDYIRMYSSRDDLLTTFFSDNFSGFTGGGDFLVKDKAEWIAITRQDFDQVKDPIKIDHKDLTIQILSETIAVATSFFTIHLPFKDHILSRETARLVLIFRKETEGWKISHSSISIPYYLVREGEVYPLKELVERNKYLEEVVSERTNQLSLANDALKLTNKKLEKEIANHNRVLGELQESEKKYRLLVDSSNEAIIVVRDGTFRLTNPMARSMTGYTEEEILKMPFQTFIHPEDRELVVDNHLRRLKGENIPNYYVFRLLHKDGSTLWVYMNAVLIDWEGGPATLNFLTDITGLKQVEEALQQSSQKWEALISASPDGIGMITLDGKIQLISDKLIKMHGYLTENTNEFLGRSVFDFIAPEDHALLIKNTKELISGKKGSRITEYRAIRKDNSKFYIDVNARILHDSYGNPTSILYVERDITERKMAEAEIKKSNQELEKLDSEKNKLFSIIAHDLRSPFHGLMGLTGVLVADSHDMTSSEIKQYSNLLHNSVAHLYTLLENLLEWAQLQKDSIDFVPKNINLSSLFSLSSDPIKQRAVQKGITIINEIPDNQFIYADEKMINSVLRNLLSNAIKYTNKGGKVVGKAKKTEQGMVEISVTDTGVGIPKNIIGKLFMLGEKVSTTGTDNEPSTGLGLLLCKEFVEKHGGKIRVESTKNVGSTFYFTVPEKDIQ